jgi:hypothetical protein
LRSAIIALRAFVSMNGLSELEKPESLQNLGLIVRRFWDL